MILNDEEIQKTFDAFLKEHPGAQWDSIMMCRAQNKAQLKKAVEEIQSKFRREVIPSGSTRYSVDVVEFLSRLNSAYFTIPKEDWKALIKEAGDEG